MTVAVTDAQAAQLFPTCPAQRLALYLPHINAALAEFFIAESPKRVAAWAAQVGHESADLTAWEESFAYTAERLVQVFPKYFPTLDSARLYVGKRAEIASRVYAYRMGNGSEASEDGWTFRGRGPNQLTGRENYRAAGRALNLPLETDPELVLRPEVGFRVDGCYWFARDLNELADRGAFELITRRINGGLNGQPDRVARFMRAKAVLGVKP